MKDFDAAVDLNYTLGLVGRAKVKLQKGDHQQALENLNLALEQRPHDGALYALRATIHTQTGDLDSAKKDDGQAELLDDGKECIICMDRRRATRLTPCQHAALCAPCAETIAKKTKSCPICAVFIEQIEYGDFLGATYNPSSSLGTMSGPNPVELLVSAARLAETMPIEELEALDDNTLRQMLPGMSPGSPQQRIQTRVPRFPEPEDAPQPTVSRSLQFTELPTITGAVRHSQQLPPLSSLSVATGWESEDRL
ncbi:hypothetical protein CYMTET_42801 [Cymbomonas tetramitiformis]|uniref:RING-type domain-containing protein n=1 Tax=Cymbomonas tetramitiformis TaxID=36881 RepID=A0AAE0C3J4_9CHLO|nr:hypothetical protein CYMTET_42801 [Cymbomonas tetramitiformis]